MHENDVPTPALIIDLAATRRNIDRMATYAAKHDIALRPHTKTHKSLRVAGMQRDAGASGLAVAKAGEARILSEAHDDIMVAYPVLDTPRTTIIAELARRTTMRTALDSQFSIDRVAEAARAAGSTVGVLVDFDTGMHRTGVQTPEQTVDLAKHVETTDGVRLDGLFTYQGNIVGSEPQIVEGVTKAGETIQHVLGLWSEHGLEAGIVTGGSTPTARWTHHNKPINEMRPGTYIYYDRDCLVIDACTIDDCAGRIVATVVSDAVPGKVVLDCGNKTLAMDQLPPHVWEKFGGGHGLIVEYPDAKIDHLTEEHGRVDVTQCDRVPKLGERVHVIPNHICVCVNLQTHVWFKDEDGQVEQAAVDTRGMLS